MGVSSQGEKAESVKQLVKQGYKLKHLLHAIGMPRSTYYFEISKSHVVYMRNKDLMELIQEIFAHHKGRYGVRRVHGELVNRGFRVNHKRVQRLMRIMRLAGKRPKEKYHSYLGEVGRVAANIINRDFSTTAPLQKWTTDVSQFTFQWGKCYLSPILDMHTNEIISYDLSKHPDLKQVRRMLSKAFKRFLTFKGLVFHSDQGWQYRHDYFISSLKEHGIIQSMSRKANCYDNGIMESFFGRMKNEMYYGHEHEFASFAEFSQAVREYIYYYNNERIQKKTAWMPPAKYREASTQIA
ncbi:IS3 family transposase [Gardnerella vaginalis]|nr:IS3 family transposase [Gardnerella vaginalis]